MTGSRFSLRVASCLRAADNLATGRQSANYKRPIGANGRLMSGHSEVASGAVRIRYSGRKSGTWALPQIGDISVEQMQSTRFPGPKKKRAVGRHGNGRMPSAGPLDIENRLRQAGK